jgi:hypothetical protein
LTFGICTTPPTVARIASAAIAIFIGPSRSAMWWSAPGKPTSVSSTSPVAGFVCSGAVVEVAVLEIAGRPDRLAEERAEDHPERVDRVSSAPK